MRTPTLQYLYLQKPVTLVVIICILSVVPCMGVGDFSMREEPNEVSVAMSILETGDWVLPHTRTGMLTDEPPLIHWLIAAFSLPQGYVSEFTARLPSALAFIVLAGFSLFFFGKRLRFQQAFIATLLLITCFEVHRAAMMTCSDILFTALLVIGLFQLFRWEDKFELKGLPISIPLLLGCAVLTKGPVGIILPLFVFGVYLLSLHKCSYSIIFKVLLYVAVSSSFLPFLWYLAAWKQGGSEFLSLSLFHVYDGSGCENGIGHNFIALIIGFMPWTLFFFFSLFGLKDHKPEKTIREEFAACWNRIRTMEKEKLFSLIAFVCILVFYSIPVGKRDVSLMSAYPFIAIFLAQYALYLSEYRTKVTRLFAAFMASVTVVMLVTVALTMSGLIDPLQIISQYTEHVEILERVQWVTNQFVHPDGLTIGILAVVLVVLAIVYYQMFKKINIKILYATIALMFAINLLIDDTDGVSSHASSGFLTGLNFVRAPIGRTSNTESTNAHNCNNQFWKNIERK